MFVSELSQFPLFQDLDAEVLRLVDRLVTPCEFQGGQVIFAQGSQANFLYIVVQSEVVVRFKPYDGPEMTVARLALGDVFGWSAALGRKSYTSSAISLTDSCAYRISGSELHRVCQQHPTSGNVIMERLAGVIAERIRRGHTGICTILTQARDI
jgi:CRP-like cAMP-binding protein